jgi:hypothetical protein
MRKLKTGFSRYTPDQLVELGSKAGPAVAKLPIFSGIKTTPAMIAAAVEDLVLKRTATGWGATVAMRASKVALARLLTAMTTELMQVPDATAVDLAASLFPMVKERERTTNVPPAPGDLRLRHGQRSQEVIASCKLRMANIRTLESQWTLDPTNGPWSNPEPATSSRRILLSGLPRGKDIWVRVRARNVIGPGGWSDPATIMVV